MAGPQKGRADYLLLGDWNVACSMCGRKRKASTMVRNWQGQFRCPIHNEPRQPQDFARGIKEVISPPWAQIETDNFVTFPSPFPVTIFPSPLQLLPGSLGIGIEGINQGAILTESGSRIITEPGFLGVASVILFPWILPVSFLWTWLSGGTGIFIADPTLSSTYFISVTTGNSGIAQCTVENSFGQTSSATVRVFS